jgi:hypothetical protein
MRYISGSISIILRFTILNNTKRHRSASLNYSFGKAVVRFEQKDCLSNHCQLESVWDRVYRTELERIKLK